MNLRLVEGAHFTTDVEHLIAGKSTAHPIPDLHYTLMAWPNHHRALHSAINYQLRTKGAYHHSFNMAECYLQRAVNFSPKDGVSYMLYGIFLHRSGKLQAALKKYNRAEELMPSNFNLLYNKALLLVELKDYGKANEYAVILYKSSYPLPGLMKKLKAAGVWDDDALKATESGDPTKNQYVQ